MSVATVRAEIKTVLEGIASVGKVNDYRRWTTDWTEIAESFIEGGKINGWMIEWNNRNGTWDVEVGRSLIKLHTFRLTGFYALQDALESSKTFEGIVDEVMNTFDFKRRLNKTVHMNEPSRLISISEQKLSAYLCHKAEIILTIEERADDPV